MATLTIRNIDPALQQRLRVRAAQNGHSMEAEMRQILKDAVGAGHEIEEVNVAEAIRRRFAPFGGVDDLVIPPREPSNDPPEFEK